MMRHRSGKPFTDRRDHYQEVTDRIVAALEAGTRPWRQPWDNGAPGAHGSMRPAAGAITASMSCCWR